METVRGKSFKNETIHVDGKVFEECEFDACTFIYSGGDTLSFSRCNFPTMCQVELADAALSTARVLAALWDSNLRPLVLPVVMGIQGLYPDGTPQVRYDPEKQLLIGVEFNGFSQNVEDTRVGQSGSKYTASFNLHVGDKSYRNLTVVVKRTTGSDELDDLEVYPIEGYEWGFEYGPFQDVVRQYYFYIRPPNLGPDNLMENNLVMGGGAHKVYRIVVNKQS